MIIWCSISSISWAPGVNTSISPPAPRSKSLSADYLVSSGSLGVSSDLAFTGWYFEPSPIPIMDFADWIKPF